MVYWRCLAGVFGTSVVCCQAYISDCVLIEEKSKYLSRIMGLQTLSSVFSPIIGAVLYKYNRFYPFYAQGIIIFCLFLMNLFFLDESPRFNENNPSINNHFN